MLFLQFIFHALQVDDCRSSSWLRYLMREQYGQTYFVQVAFIPYTYEVIADLCHVGNGKQLLQHMNGVNDTASFASRMSVDLSSIAE